MTTTQSTSRTTTAFYAQAALSFAVAITAVSFGIYYLPVNGWIRALTTAGAARGAAQRGVSCAFVRGGHREREGGFEIHTPGGIFDPQASDPKGTPLDMCRQVKCRQCSKTTWAGCGQHVNQVMAGVPSSHRCSCSSDASAASGGFWGKLIGR